LQAFKLPDWQLIATAGSIERESNLLEVFIDVLPFQSSSTALANATKVCQYIVIFMLTHRQWSSEGANLRSGNCKSTGEVWHSDWPSKKLDFRSSEIIF